MTHATGSGDIRGALEHRSHDPFSGNVAAVLAGLEPAWGDIYAIAWDGTWWTAARRDGTGDPLKSLTSGGLIAAMREAR